MAAKQAKKEWFKEPVEMIEFEQVVDAQSAWGNTYSYITKEQLEDLQNGKLVYIDDGEYCHFIMMKGE